MSVKEVEGFYPLSPMQQGMLYHTLYAPESGAYLQQVSCTLHGKLNVVAFEQAWQEVINRYAVLRSTFLWEKLKGPIQLVQRQVKLPFEQQDWQDRSAAQQETALEALLVADRARGFELAQAPLLRLFLLQLAPDSYRFIWSHHHILFDGWSVPLLLQEVFAFYEAGCRGETLTLEQPRPFRDYIVWLKQQDLSRAEVYWRKALAGFSTPTRLSIEHAVTGESGYGEEQVRLSAEQSEQVQRFAREQQVTVNTVVQGAWALLLSRYSGEEEVLFGATVSGRPAELAGVEQMVGLFINSLPVRVRVSGEAQVGTWLRELQAQVMELRQYEYSPLVEVQGWSEVRRGQNLFETLVVFENYPVAESLGQQKQSLKIEQLRITEQNSFALTLLSSPNASLRLSYDRRVYETGTVKQLLSQLQTLLLGMVNEPAQQLRSLALLSVTERQQLLVEWNARACEYAEEQQCIDQLFAAQVRQTPESVAVIYGEQQLTYEELNGRANQVAHYLQQWGVGPEVKVGVFMERSLEMMLAVLGIVKAGAAYVPLDPNYPAERLSYMLAAASIEVLITQAQLEQRLPAHSAQVLSWERDWERIAQQPESTPERRASADNLLYVIYTSGSTGQPKGVAMTHRGVYQLLSWQGRNLALEAGQRTLQMASLSFDVSFQEIFTSWCSGGTLVLLSETERRDGQKLLAYLKAAGIERLFLPFVALQQLAELADEESLAQLQVREVIASGEQLRITPPLVRFFSGLPDCVLYNQYGPSESHVVTSFTLTGPAASWPSLPPLGRPLDNSQTYILDEQLQPVPVGLVGELYIGGMSLSRGYLNQPSLTAARYLPNPYGAAGTRLYQTGDQAKYQSDGNIEYVGRGDQQVKFRGYRIELGEIEAVLDQHPGVSEAVVLVRAAEDGSKRLVAYVVSEPAAAVTVHELREFLQSRLPEYMVPGVFVPLAELPLTPSGKVDRRALPEPDGSRPELEKEYVAPRTAVEEVLAGIWSEVLGVEQVGVEDNFFELGGHSLLATQVVSRVREAFRLELPLSELFESATVRALAAVIEAGLRGGSELEDEPIRAVSRSESLPLSFAQQRLWFLDQLEPGTATYNIPIGIRLSGQLDVEALERSISEVVRRHETLRTRFVTVDGAAQQVIEAAEPVKLLVTELGGLEAAEQEEETIRLANEEARQPFDLEHGPLWRAQLIRLNAAEHVLLFTMHHIISDGWSMGVLVREVSALYEAYVNGGESALAELPIQYADFAVWQREYLQGAVLERQLQYWREQLAGAPPVLQLPTDHPRPAIQSYRGAQIDLQFSPELSSGLKELSQREGMTLFMTLLAVWEVLLWRYTGQKDVVVGTTIANRQRSEIEGLIGFFVNSLVLRTQLQGNESGRALLRRVREVCLGGYAHQDVPFEMLVEELRPERDMSHTPLFQVMFTVQNAPMAALQWPGVSVSRVAAEHRTARFELNIGFGENEQGIVGSIDYNTDLFERETIERLVSHYEQLASALVANVERPVSEWRVLSDVEQEKLLVEWNNTASAYPRESSIHELFAQQAARTPQAVALRYEDQSLTYRELNERSNQLAHYLLSLELGAEARVGLLLQRSPELVIAMLGVLKAGMTYLPLDATYPAERLRFMVKDGAVAVLLSEEQLLGSVPEIAGPMLNVAGLWRELAAYSTSDPQLRVDPEQLAYVIYTSGSTGTPKGVAIPHRGVVRLVRENNYAELNAEHTFLLLAPICFDASTFEIWGPLLNGGQLAIMPPRTPTLEELGQALKKYEVTTFWLTSGLFQALVEEHVEYLQPVRQLLTGGDVLSVEHVQKALRSLPECRLIACYGPTETTTFASFYGMTSGEQITAMVPIGTPIANTEVYVLDEELKPVPLGVVGELYIGGDGLARGYHGRAELTAERFVPQRYSQRGGERLYRTGDLVRWRADGQLEFQGRLDGQVKVRGYRIELGEVETVLQQHEGVSEAVVVVQRNDEGHKQLVAYVVRDQEAPGIGELRDYVKARLPEYMVPGVYIWLDALPLTANGKVDRKALPQPDGSRPALDHEFVASRDAVEEVLAKIWSELLGVEKVGVHDNFFELGGDSIISIQIVARARQQGLAISARELFQYQTIAELASVATMAEGTEAAQGDLSGPLPLTPIQHWFFEKELVDAHHFNQSVLLSVQQPVKAALLRELVAALLRHHDGLRLRFTRSEEGWSQEIARFEAEEEVPLTVLDYASVSDEELQAEIEAEATRVQGSLDLSAGPLLRVVLFELGAGRGARLLLVIHHLAVDGVSWRILVEDLQRGYEQLERGERVELGAKTSSYQQWAESLQEYGESAALQEQQSYWEGVWQEPVWRVPGWAGGGNQVKQMQVVRQVLSAEETRALLQDVPGIYHTQIQEVLLTGLAETLSRWSGARRVVVEVEGHGREELHRAVDVTRTVGWFTTIYPVGLETAAGASTGERLKQIKEQVRAIPQHGIGYGVLRYLKRTLSAGAEGEISFNYLGQFDQVLTEDGLLAGARESAGEIRSGEGKRHYKVEVGASVAGGQLQVSWSYSREQLEAAEMERVSEWYMEELREIIRHCAEPAAGGYTPSDFSLAKLDQRQLDEVATRYNDLEDIYPMTPMQQGILYHILYAPESSLYITQITCTIHEALDINAFEHAWQEMLNRHSMLRTAFVWHGLDDPLQIVSHTVKLPLEILDWQTLSATEQQTEIEKLLEADRARGFDFAQAPLLRLFLLRLSPDSYHFIWSSHHLLLDGWSVPLLLQEVFAFYEAGCRGETLDLEQPRPFRDYIVWLKRQDMSRAEAYWRKALAGFSTPTQLSLEHSANGNVNAAERSGFAEEQMLLSVEQSEQLERFAREQQVTVNTVVQGAWALLLSRYSGEEDVLFGATVSGRPAELAGVEHIVGMFINSLPVRVRVRGEAQIGSWLRELQAQVMELRQYEYSPLVKIQNWSEVKRGQNLFDTLVVFDNYPVGDALKESGKRVKVENAGFTEQNNYPLTLTAATVPDLMIRMGYDRQRFETTGILRLLDELKISINQIVANPDGPIADIKQVLIETDMKNQMRARIVQNEQSRNKFMTVKPKPVRLATLGG